jgi:multiple sugar transport system substrate-binding protein
MDNDQTVFVSPTSQGTQNLLQTPTEAIPVAQGLQQSTNVAASNLEAPTVRIREEKLGGGNSFAIVKKIFKILLGLFVLLFVFSFVFFVILPAISKNSSKQVTLTYWGLWEDSRNMQGLISDFEKDNLNIKIDYLKQDAKQYRGRLVTRIGNGTGPDIFRFHNSWLPMLSGGMLALPSDTISKDDFKKYFYPVTQQDLIRNGAIYGIPLEIDTLSLFVNTQLLQAVGIKQPPATWDDFIATAQKIRVRAADGKIKTAGAALGTYGNITHAPDIISLLFLQNGVNLSDLGSSASRAEDALNFYTKFSLDQNNVWDDTLDPSIVAFSKGSLGMYFGYSWDYYTIKQANPDLAFQIAPVPQLSSNQEVTLASYWAEGISAGTKHPKEALLFMKYLANKDTEEKFFTAVAKTRAFGEPYARVDLAQTLKTNDALSAIVSQAPSAKSSFMVDGTYDEGLNQQSNTYLENAVNSILNGGSAQTAVETLAQGISQVQQKYGQ